MKPVVYTQYLSKLHYCHWHLMCLLCSMCYKVNSDVYLHKYPHHYCFTIQEKEIMSSRFGQIFVFVVILVLCNGCHGGKSSSYLKHLWMDPPQQLSIYNHSGQFCNGGQCPPWSYCDSHDGFCKCKDLTFVCNEAGHRVAILSCYCLSYNNDANTTKFGLCIYGCFRQPKEYYPDELAYVTLPYSYADLDISTCGRYNRHGLFCGKCKNKSYMRAYSYDLTCYECSSSVWLNLVKYISLAFLPLTLLSIIVLIFRINIPLSCYQGYVFYCQVISCPIIMRECYLLFSKYASYSDSNLFRLGQFFVSLCGFWNLDFFRGYNHNICFRLHSLTNMSLDYLLAIYPLLLMAFTYAAISLYDRKFKIVIFVSKPVVSLVKKFNLAIDLKKSAIDAFATFMLLSNVKFLSVSFDLLCPVQVTNSEDNSHEWALFYDTSVSYFGSVHLPYAILAILVLLLFVLVPIAILILYPLAFFQRFMTFFPRRLRLVLFVFLDSFQGCYKDGTESGVRDCRWFSAVPFIARLMIFSSYNITITPLFPCSVLIIFHVLALITVVVEPFKPSLRSHQVDSIVYVGLFACLNASIVVTNFLGDTHHGTWLYYILVVLMALSFAFYTAVSVFYLIIRRRLSCFVKCISVSVQRMRKLNAI